MDTAALTPITLDFETYYDSQFSLSKMPQVLYLRDERFQVLCCAVAVGDEPVRVLLEDEFEAWTRTIAWDKALVVAHNCIFDGGILWEKYGIRPAAYACTMGLSQAFLPQDSHKLAKVAETLCLTRKGSGLTMGSRKADKKLTDYAAVDTEICRDVFNLLYPHLPEQERQIMSLTIKWGVVGKFELDKALLTKVIADETAKRDATIAASGYSEAELSSNQKFAKILNGLGVQVPVKVSARTGEETSALGKGDDEFVALMDNNPELSHVWEGRLAAKSLIGIRRPETFLKIANTAAGTLPAPLRYFGSRTGRWSGTDYNLQNLPQLNKSDLRKTLIAPKGYQLVVVDSAQIELRVNAWFCQQRDKLRMLEEGTDLYRVEAATQYNIPYEEIGKNSLERKVGKAKALGCGYGMGAVRFRAWCAAGPLGMDPLHLTAEEAQEAITTYRAGNMFIAGMWRTMAQQMYSMTKRDYKKWLGPVEGVIRAEYEGFSLPNGMKINYPALRCDDDSWKYGIDKAEYFLHGGKCLENCIAAGTEVLCERGWVPIEHVRADDKVHDGVEFVTHGGLLFKSIQPCVIVDGVFMTADHEVLTDDGWKAASENPEPLRPALRDVSWASPRAERREEAQVGVPVRLWEHGVPCGCGRYEGGETWRNAELRVRYEGTTVYEGEEARHVSAPSVLGVEEHAGQVQASFASGVAELRRSWNNCVRTLGAKFFELLGRHGWIVSARARFGSCEQRSGLLSRELPLDYTQSERAKQKELDTRSGFVRSSSDDGHRRNDPVLALDARVADRGLDSAATKQKAVYDIMNCGPRHRFVVRGENAPFIVHNCIQGLARIIVADQIMEIEKEYETVLSVHDEVVYLAKDSEAEDALKFGLEVFQRVPDWAKGLCLGAEGGFAEMYSK